MDSMGNDRLRRPTGFRKKPLRFAESKKYSDRKHEGNGPPKNVAFWFREMGNPAISGKSRLVKYYVIWPDGCIQYKSLVAMVCISIATC